MDKALKKINLRLSGDNTKLEVNPDTIPNLVPTKILSEWMNGDESPHFKIQKIDFPILANRYNYTESFFESFVNKLNSRPIPGSKSGHETSWGKRAPTDILLVGGKIEKNGDGTGSVYLKNYFPPVGESGSNEILIRESKSDMIEFSLVSYTRDVREELPDGAVRYDVVESMYGERNDIVGYAEGAMQQKTNTTEDQSHRDSVDKNNNLGEGMDKEKVLEALTTLKENNGVSLPEIAKHLNLEALIITDEQKAAVAKMNAVKALCGDADPEEFVKGLIKERKENAEAVREAKLVELFGAKEVDGKENQVRTYVDSVIGDTELSEAKVNEIKQNSIFKTLAAEQAQYDSDFNRVGASEKVNVSDEPKVMDF